MIIGVSGGKGGIGKSTISVSIAYQLSKRYKVLLVDADVGCPNDHLILDVEREKVKDIYNFVPKFDLSKCIRCGRCGASCMSNAIVSIVDKYPILIEDNCNGCRVCKSVCPVGAIKEDKRIIGSIYKYSKWFDCISAESIVGFEEESIIVKRLKDYLKTIESSYDFIVIDSPAGIGCPVINALKDCDYLYLVTEPTPYGAHDLSLTIKLAESLGINYNVVVNRASLGNKDIIYNMVNKSIEIPFNPSLYTSFQPITSFDFVNDIESIKGVYALLLDIERPLNIIIGSLGEIHFKKGKYIYVGSAMNGILKRVKRHRLKEKRLHWHIDYLTANKYVKVLGAYFKLTNSKQDECNIAELISNHSKPIIGFGSTDTKCRSHLFNVKSFDIVERYMRRLF